MPTTTLVELDVAALEADQSVPAVVAPDRLTSNEQRMASCLTRYDLKKNCIHIHD